MIGMTNRQADCLRAIEDLTVDGVSPTFEQANTQITTITGGNPNLKPEKSKSWQLGTVYSPSWAEGLAGTQRLDFGLTWYNHRITNAIGARDIQALLDACIKSGRDDINHFVINGDFDLDIRIDRAAALGHGQRLVAPVLPSHRWQLAVGIGDADIIGVDQAQMADRRAHQRLHDPRAHPAHAHHGHLAAAQVGDGAGSVQPVDTGKALTQFFFHPRILRPTQPELSRPAAP